MTESVAKIRRRIELLERQVADLRAILLAIESGSSYVAPSGLQASCPDRVLTFLRRHPEMTFSAKQLRDAVGAGEESIRKTLSRLRAQGLVIHVAYGAWKLTPAARGDAAPARDRPRAGTT